MGCLNIFFFQRIMAKIDKKRKMVKILWETESIALYADPSDANAWRSTCQLKFNITRDGISRDFPHIGCVEKFTIQFL